jgi:hypothetical protein
MAATEENRAIAKYLDEVFSPDEKDVRRYYDDNHESMIHILKASNSPRKGVMSFATIGLSDHENRFDTGADIRVEIVGGARDDFREFGNAIATVAFFMINSGWLAYPGKVFPDVLKMYELSKRMHHLLLVPVPRMWSKDFEPMDFDTKTVHFLGAIPISESERRHVEEHGDETFGSLLEEHEVDIFNLDRDPVV